MLWIDLLGLFCFFGYLYSCALFNISFLFPLQLFAANQNKPPDIISILVANRSKLLRLFADFKTDKGITEIHLDWDYIGFVRCICGFGTMFKFFGLFSDDEQFEADKAQVLKEIAALEPREHPWVRLVASYILFDVFLIILLWIYSYHSLKTVTVSFYVGLYFQCTLPSSSKPASTDAIHPVVCDEFVVYYIYIHL